MGIIPPGTELSARPDWVPAWDSLSADERRLYARQMEVYAAFLEQTDHHIGRVVSYLEETGELDNTLIFLTSDNGASSEGGPFGSFNENHFPNRVESTVEDNLAHIDDWGGVRSFPNYSWGWAWAGNTPLKRWKRYLHQGGMSDALVVHWPQGIEGRGEVRGQYAHVSDVVPTVLDALGLHAPATIGGVAQKPIEGTSFAHTFGNATVPTNKSVQYYEMIGSRAIWKDGWKAVAEQEQGVILTEALLDAQTWELYHVAEDFSESVDLADRHPERLQELITLWWSEAEKYNVLPLDSRMQARMAEPKPLASRPSGRYVYYPGGAPSFEYTAVNVKNRSHTITAFVEIPAASDGAVEGVLLAHGSWFAGYALYIQDGRLHYVHNYLGLAEYRISAVGTLPTGAATLRFAFAKTGEHQGIGTLFVNDEQVGEGEIPRTVPGVIETSGEGLCCGYDSGLPVTDQYRAPFRFTGTLKRVVVEVDGPERDDADARLRAAFTTQ